MSHGTTALSINHEAKNPPSELRVSRCRHGPRGSQNVAGPLWRRRVCFCTHCQAHVVNALDGGGRMHVATVSTAMTRQLLSGQPTANHFPHTAAPRLQGVLPICHLHFAPLHMNGNSGYRPALCADWPGYWPARRAAAQQRLQLCSGWAGCTNQCNVLESSKTACTGENRRGADARHGRSERHASCCTIDPAGRRPIAVCG